MIVEGIEVSHQLLVILNKNVGVVFTFNLFKFVFVALELFLHFFVHTFKKLQFLWGVLIWSDAFFTTNWLFKFEGLNFTLQFFNVPSESIVEFRMQQIQSPK